MISGQKERQTANERVALNPFATEEPLLERARLAQLLTVLGTARNLVEPEIRHGLPLLEAHRRATGYAAYGAAGACWHFVVGALWLTVVDREGTRQYVIPG